MHLSRINQLHPSKEYVFTVSNLSHQLVSPEQYTQIVSTISQYQVVPGFLSDYIDDPWDVVLALLPFSKSTLLDVTLPYTKSQDSGNFGEQRILARYLLYKQTVIGIKLCTSDKRVSSQQQLNPQKFTYTEKPIPSKVLQYYTEHQIINYCLQIPVGDFYLITNKFKIALLFQSEIKDERDLNPYIEMGCQIISIVNNEEYDFQQFNLNYSNPYYRNLIVNGHSTLVGKIKQKCSQKNVILLYAGCKTCPSLKKIHFSRSFIEFQSAVIQNQDVEFMSLVDLSQHINFAEQPQFNYNRLNISHLFQFGGSRIKRHTMLTQALSNKQAYRSSSKDKQYPMAFQIDSRKYDIKPISQRNKEKYIFCIHRNSNHIPQKREKMFKSFQIPGRTLVRCMYVFNMLNLFIFSKASQMQSPFTLGLPFTNKSKNLFDILVFIFDHLKNLEVEFPDLYENVKLSSILELYRYKEEKQKKESNHENSFVIEQQMISQISGQPKCRFSYLQQLLQNHQKQKPLYLCADDLQEKKKFKNMCKEKNVQCRFIDLIMVDEFNLPMEIRLIYGRQVEQVLELGQPNILEKYQLKLRPPSSLEQQTTQLEKKRMQYPLNFLRLCQQVNKKNFSTLKQALKFIIVEKQFANQESNKDLFRELIIGQMGKKYRSSIKILSPICKLFITAPDDFIIKRADQLTDQIIRENMQLKGNSFNSLPSNAQLIQIVDSGDEQLQNINVNQPKQINKKKINQKSPEELYSLRIQRCRSLKQDKIKNLIVRCHRCQSEMYRKFMQKCSKCHENVCLSCIQEISGLSGFKASKQLSKFCPVCTRVCECQKCKKRTQRNVQNNKIQNKQSSAEAVMRSAQHDTVRQSPQNFPQLSSLFKSFTEQKTLSGSPVKSCEKCQILNIGQKRCIDLQCPQCGKQECYYCVEQRYKIEKYKPKSMKWFYKNWKCFICDKQWEKHLENKKTVQEKQRLEKQRKVQDEANKNKMIHENQTIFTLNMNDEVASNHTSHYANDQLMTDVAGFQDFITKKDNEENYPSFGKSKVNNKFYKQESTSVSILKSEQVSRLSSNRTSLNGQDPNFTFPLPDKPFFQIITKDVPSKTNGVTDQHMQGNSTFSIKNQQTKHKKNNSSDSGYDSRQKFQSKRVEIAIKSIPDASLKTNSKGAALWGKSIKNNRKKSSSRSSSEKSKNVSQYSFRKQKNQTSSHDRNGQMKGNNTSQQTGLKQKIQRERSRDKNPDTSKKQEASQVKKSLKVPFARSARKKVRQSSPESGCVSSSSSSKSSSSNSSVQKNNMRKKVNKSSSSSSTSRSNSSDKNRRANKIQIKKSNQTKINSGSQRRSSSKRSFDRQYHDRNDSKDRQMTKEGSHDRNRSGSNSYAPNDRFDRGKTEYQQPYNKRNTSNYQKTYESTTNYQKNNYNPSYKSHSNNGFSRDGQNGFNRNGHNGFNRDGQNGFNRDGRNNYQSSNYGNQRAQNSTSYVKNSSNYDNINSNANYSKNQPNNGGEFLFKNTETSNKRKPNNDEIDY